MVVGYQQRQGVLKKCNIFISIGAFEKLVSFRGPLYSGSF